MGHYKLLFPHEFLCAADLQERDVTLTISSVGMESLRREDNSHEDRPVVEFEEMKKRPKDKRKRWVLNVTNAKTIAKLYGTDTDKWQGKRVTLYPTTCKAFGDVVDCIRVRGRKPRGRARPMPEHEDQRPPVEPEDESQAEPPPPDEDPTDPDNYDPTDEDAP